MKFIIWGTGNFAKLAIEHVEYVNSILGYDWYEVACFVDNDVTKNGKLIFGVNVVTPNDLANLSYPIVIAINDSYEVEKQINEMGKKYISFNEFVYKDILLGQAWRTISDKENPLYLKMMAQEMVATKNNSIGLVDSIIGSACYYSDKITDAEKYLNSLIKYSAKSENKNIKTIALYYNRFFNGGVEKVLSHLTFGFCDKGYRVILITDEFNEESEYSLPENVDRIVMNISIYKNLYKWLNDINEILKKYSVDVLISHRSYWEGNFYLSYLCHIVNVKFIAEIHTHYSGFVSYDKLEYYKCLYRSPDAVVCLSEDDCKYWRKYGVKAYYIQNTVVIHDNNYGLNKNNDILWIGRLDQISKRILDLPEIVRSTLKFIPNIIFRVVGKFENEKVETMFWSEVHKYGLSDNLIFDGYRSNVDYAYDKAKIMLLTSNYEGFPMILAEAFGYGVPVISYNLNYLSLLEDGKGCILVDIGDTDKMADEIVRLSTDENRLLELSEEAYNKAKRFSEVDVIQLWENMINETL